MTDSVKIYGQEAALYELVGIGQVVYTALLPLYQAVKADEKSSKDDGIESTAALVIRLDADTEPATTELPPSERS